MTLERINQSEGGILRTALFNCCGSHAWVESMIARRPYPHVAALHQSAEEIWTLLKQPDWLEAFAAHPKIGARKPAQKWSTGEQSGMSRASGETAASIARMNGEYERKFGYIFIVCASGKSAEEIHDALGRRIGNAPQVEISLAAGEQLKIIHLRLDKLLAE